MNYRRRLYCTQEGLQVEFTLHSNGHQRSALLVLIPGIINFVFLHVHLPGGRACRYWHFSVPFGQSQNHPYFPLSTASRKNLQTMELAGKSPFFSPCFLLTTSWSLSSSQSSMLSSFLSSRASANTLRFSVFLLR